MAEQGFRRVQETWPAMQITSAVLARLRRLHASGYSDQDIADRIGCHYSTIYAHRHRLGLASNGYGARWRAKRREAYRRQCQREGIRGLAEIWVIQQRIELARTGWPLGLQRRSVEILEVLARGPATKRQVVEALGLRWRGYNSLSSGGQSYFGDLARRGLIVQECRGCRPAVYRLAPGVKRQERGCEVA